MLDSERTFKTPLGALEHELRSSVEQEQLRAWMTFRPSRVYGDLVLNWAGIVLSLCLMGHFQTWWAFVLGTLFIGFRQYGLFILGHDGAHWCLHSSHKINDFLTRWFILGPLCMSLEGGRRNHLEHHKTLGTEADPDRYLHTFSNKNSLSEFILFCSGLSTFAKTVRKVTTVKQPLSGAGSAAKGSSDLSIFMKQRIPIIVAQPLIIALIYICHLPLWSYFFVWIAPIYFGVFLPDEIRAFCDHAIPIVPDNEADRHRLVSFEPSWVEAMIYSPYNMNYHAEHHLWPGVPYYNRHAVYRHLKERSGVTYRKSYTVFLFSLLKALPLNRLSNERNEGEMLS